MELAKVTSKGQITIPIDIRRRYGLHEGSKVMFMEDGDKVYLMNSNMIALKEAQAAFAGAAEELGLVCEDDVAAFIKEYRKRRSSKK